MNSIRISRMQRVCHALVAIAAGVVLSTAAHAAGETFSPGEALYKRSCQICHQAPFMGYFMLSRRLGKERADLAQRTDLEAPYVNYVVRNGLLGMLAINRGELSDAELQQVIAYLQRLRMPVLAESPR